VGERGGADRNGMRVDAAGGPFVCEAGRDLRIGFIPMRR
jgi:hypothetical protein